MGSSGSLNHIYRTVWNQALGAMVAVAEISTGRGKSATVPGHSKVDTCAGWPAHRLQNALLSLAIAFAWGAIPTLTFANPSGGVAIQGQATFATNGSNLLVTTQNGAGLNHSAINWQNFSIPTGSTTYFQQPNASSTSINRVVTNTPSLIFGTVGSNGNLVLVNQSGITVGAGAVVDTAGFTASTLRMNDADALSGRMRFGDAASATGTVSVMGSVLARSGDVVLMGSSVETGSNALVQAPNGNTVLAAGQQIEITGRGLEGIVMQVQAPTDSAVNLGTLKGDAVGIFAGTLKHSGLIQATTATLEGGKVVLKASHSADVSGIISASGTKGGSIDIAVAHSTDPTTSGALVQTGAVDAAGYSGAGGTVHLTADSILSAASIAADGIVAGGQISVLAANRALSTTAAQYSANGAQGQGGDILVSANESNYTSGSYSAIGATGGGVTIAGSEIKLAGTQIDVSGKFGGGRIHVGGLMHGDPGFGAQGNTFGNSDTFFANGASSFKADATQNGNGGEVVLWSDKTLRFSGSISAKGGAIGGDGGQAEVSGLAGLGYNGLADLSAAKGKAGTLLLDPKNINIVSGTGTLSYLEFMDPTPGAVGFGVDQILVLPNGNVVVASPKDGLIASQSGGVYSFTPNGTLISALVGSTANDRVGWGGIVTTSDSVNYLPNNNYLILSYLWSNGLAASAAGAVTWASGTTGVSGIVSSTNSLVGGSSNDVVGGPGDIRVLSNGNYVVISSAWKNPVTSAIGAGAVTWGSGVTGVSGVVSSTNSLVGTTASDYIGNLDIQEVGNGNFVVRSPYWSNSATGAASAGAVTWVSGSNGHLSNWTVSSPGIGDVVSASNSLVGGALNDQVGGYGVSVLSNGNYWVTTPSWNGNKGAVTWGSASGGVSGLISSSNSLIGSASGDRVGEGGVTEVGSGNYVVVSPNWTVPAGAGAAVSSAGAVTWGDGTIGITGTISSANSLVGGTSGDQVGSSGVTVLSNPNRNYLVKSPKWSNGGSAVNAGAVTWGSGSTGVSGTVLSSNSLVGSTANDSVGGGFSGVREVGSGNYVVVSPYWTVPAFIGQTGIVPAVSSVGAVTWGDGTNGTSGLVSSSNSLVGGTVNDQVGNSGVTVLSNGNYVVTSPGWSDPTGAVTGAGAVTWVKGLNGHLVNWTGGAIGAAVSSGNSLVGSVPGDTVGSYGVVPVGTGNYVVISPAWGGGKGAVTWVNGSTGTAGHIGATATAGIAASLVGGTAGDAVGSSYLSVFADGNYLVQSPNWNNGGSAANAGAVTWGSGAAGVSGLVDGTPGTGNSLVGSTAGDVVGLYVQTSANTAVVRTPLWTNPGLNPPATRVANAGAVTWLDGTNGKLSDGSSSGPISTSNSLLGTSAGDSVGSASVTWLSNGNMAISSPLWGSGGGANALGAVTWMSGATGKLATLSTGGALGTVNSLVGSTLGDSVGGAGITVLSNGNYLVRSPNWTNSGQFGAGALTWVNGTTGELSNSTVGTRVYGGLVDGTTATGNSLVGSTSGDMSTADITQLVGANAVVANRTWNNGGIIGNAGAVTWINGSTGKLADGSTAGAIGAGNSLVGITLNDHVGTGYCPDGCDPGVFALSNGNYVVNSYGYHATGAVSLGSGSNGLVGSVTTSNSLLVQAETVMEMGNTGKALVGSIKANAGAGGLFLLGAATSFADAPGADATFGADNLVATLRAGTNVLLQANNDITVNAAINVSAGASAPGTLTLQAGRSVILNEPITTGGADLLVSTDDLGAITANRDAGIGGFFNNVGSNGFNTGAGRWLVYASSPANVTKGGLISTLYQYGTVFGSAVNSVGSGFVYASGLSVNANFSGQLASTYGTAPTATLGYSLSGLDVSDTSYTLAQVVGTPKFSYWPIDATTSVGTYALQYESGLSIPGGSTLAVGTAQSYEVKPMQLTVTASLTGSTRKVYDGTTTALLTPFNFSLVGFVNGDQAGITRTSGDYASKNAGSGLLVSTTLAPGDFAPQGNTQLSNYILPTTASGNIGSITPFALTLNTPVVRKTYDGTTTYTTTVSDLGALSSALFSGDTVSSATIKYADKNAGLGNKTAAIAGLTINDGNGGNNYNVTLAGNTTSTIDKAVVTLTAPSITKTYDGTTAYTTTAADLAAMLTVLVSGDSVASATLSYASPNAGSGNKVVTLGAFTINDGNGGANYTLTTNGNANSTINPLTVLWTGNAGTGLWSNTGNWSSPFVPDGTNVITPSNLSVTTAIYDLTAPTSVQSINASGSFTLQSGALNITGDLITPSYTQTGGTLSVSGALTVQNAFTQTAGNIDKTGPVSITQATGDLTVGNVTGSSITLQAPTGAIKQWPSTGLTGLVTLRTTGGASLTDAANRISGFAVADVVSGGVSTRSSGNIALTNGAAMDLSGISLANGNLSIDNTGGISNSVAIKVDGGTVDIKSHSPITVSSAVTASGNITLAALTPDGTSNITLNGAMTSTAGGISIQAYNNFIQNSNLSAALAIDVSTIAGSLTFGPGAYSIGNPVTYTVNGAPYMPPWIASTLSGGATDFVVAFLDQFQAVLDAQQAAPIDDPLGLMQSSQEGIVVEGEICKP